MCMGVYFSAVFYIAGRASCNHLHCVDTEEIRHRKDPMLCLFMSTDPLLLLPLCPLATTNLFPSSKILSFPDCHISGKIILNVISSDWLLNNIIHVRSIQGDADISSFLLLSSTPRCGGPQFAYPFTYRRRSGLFLVFGYYK